MTERAKYLNDQLKSTGSSYSSSAKLSKDQLKDRVNKVCDVVGWSREDVRPVLEANLFDVEDTIAAILDGKASTWETVSKNSKESGRKSKQSTGKPGRGGNSRRSDERNARRPADSDKPKMNGVNDKARTAGKKGDVKPKSKDTKASETRKAPGKQNGESQAQQPKPQSEQENISNGKKKREKKNAGPAPTPEPTQPTGPPKFSYSQIVKNNQAPPAQKPATNQKPKTAQQNGTSNATPPAKESSKGKTKAVAAAAPSTQPVQQQDQQTQPQQQDSKTVDEDAKSKRNNKTWQKKDKETKAKEAKENTSQPRVSEVKTQPDSTQAAAPAPTESTKEAFTAATEPVQAGSSLPASLVNLANKQMLNGNMPQQSSIMIMPQAGQSTPVMIPMFPGADDHYQQQFQFGSLNVESAEAAVYANVHMPPVISYGSVDKHQPSTAQPQPPQPQQLPQQPVAPSAHIPSANRGGHFQNAPVQHPSAVPVHTQHAIQQPVSHPPKESIGTAQDELASFRAGTHLDSQRQQPSHLLNNQDSRNRNQPPKMTTDSLAPGFGNEDYAAQPQVLANTAVYGYPPFMTTTGYPAHYSYESNDRSNMQRNMYDGQPGFPHHMSGNKIGSTQQQANTSRSSNVSSMQTVGSSASKSTGSSQARGLSMQSQPSDPLPSGSSAGIPQSTSPDAFQSSPNNVNYPFGYPPATYPMHIQPYSGGAPPAFITYPRPPTQTYPPFAAANTGHNNQFSDDMSGLDGYSSHQQQPQQLQQVPPQQPQQHQKQSSQSQQMQQNLLGNRHLPQDNMDSNPAAQGLGIQSQNGGGLPLFAQDRNASSQFPPQQQQQGYQQLYQFSAYQQPNNNQRKNQSYTR